MMARCRQNNLSILRLRSSPKEWAVIRIYLVYEVDMNLTQNQLERLQDLTARGELTTDQANIEMVKMMRVRAVSKLPSLCSALSSKKLASAIKAIEAIIEHEGFE